MFCPKCGQQQVSEDTRFCSRCGLAISGLPDWLEGGGALSVREGEAPAALASLRRKIIQRGAKLMLLSGILMPIFLVVSFLVDGPLIIPLIIPFTIFLVGLSFMLYARLFVAEAPPAKSQQAQPPSLGATGGAALPPASNIRMNNVGGQPVSTAELVQPPSVTEHTTKLLDSD